MKNITSKIILFVASIFLFSCQNNKETTHNNHLQDKYQFKVKKTIKIQLDTMTRAFKGTPQVIGNEIVFFNPQRRALQFYDITQKQIKLSRKINFSYEGENAVSGIMNFLIHNKDSIFLLAPYQYQLFLVNTKAKLLNTYKLITEKIGKNTSLPDPAVVLHNPLFFSNNNLYISAYPDRNLMTKTYYEAKTLVIKLDLKTEKFTYLYEYPYIYRKNIYTITHSSFTRVYSEKHKKFVYNFFADNNIYVTDLKDINKPYYAGYIGLKEVPSLPKFIMDNKENNETGMKMPYFMDFRYDKHKDMYIRTLKMASQDDKTKGTLIHILLNGNFEKIGEIKASFADDKVHYYIRNSFFTPDGMYIQKIDPQEKEGVLVYDLVELVKE